MNNQNVFERLAARNQESNFSPISSPESQDSADLTDQTGGNIFDRFAQMQKDKEKNQFGLFDTLRDVSEQVSSKGLSGVGGAYGNLLDTFGLQLKEGQSLPGQQARNALQFGVLEKLDRGEVPTIDEFMSLSEEEPISRVPTSKELQGGIENLTGIGEGKTPAGRIAGRGAEFLGEGLAIPGGGTKALATLAGSGLAGQSIREAGGPEALASGVEIGFSIIPSALSGKLNPSGITKASKEVKGLVEAGRKVGLTEKQIAPLIQGESKSALLSKVARKGTKTQERFASIKESLGDSYQNIKNSISKIGDIGEKNERTLFSRFQEIKDDLNKTLHPSQDKKDAIKFIEDSLEKLRTSGTTPEELINFWQDINKSVKWGSIQGGKKALTRLKEPILEVLNNVSPQAAKDFELTNQLYSKYSQIAKKLKPEQVDAFFNKVETLGIPTAAISLLGGNPWALKTLGGLATEASLRVLAREMLISPYFQNVATKLVKNFNSGSVKGVTETVKQVQEYMKRKHPNEDWEFLTQD